MWFERDGKVLVSLPGVPFEMKTLIGEQVLPRLYEHFRFDAIVHKTAITYGLAESSSPKRSPTGKTRCPPTCTWPTCPAR